LKILVPSIVDPATHKGGAGTVTRAFLRVLEGAPLNAEIRVVFPTSAKRKFHRGRQVASLARSLVSSLPSKALLTHSRKFRRDFQQVLRDEQFDLVLLNGSDLLWLLPYVPAKIPRILVAHNIEHQLFQSQIDSLYPDSRVRRAALMRDCNRLREFEMSGIRNVNNVIFLSKDDAEFALTENPGVNSLTVPPIFDGIRASCGRSRDSRSGLQIGFMGNFAWWPNREGLRWFLKEVFPHTGPDTRLHLFGDRSAEAAPADSRIVNHGFIADPRDIWSRCDFMICPIRFGGGVNVKFAEAVYNRVPVLASSFAARGLPLERDPGIVLLDSTDQWIEFLRSPAALALGSRSLPHSIGDAFAMQPQITRVQTFVQRVMLA